MPPWFHRITNKHIIVAQSNGQIYDLDLLQVHPRRPTTDPTLAGDGHMRRPFQRDCIFILQEDV